MSAQQPSPSVADAPPPARPLHDGDVTAGAPRGDVPAPGETGASVWRVVGDPLVAAAREGVLSGSRVAVKDVFAVAGHAIGMGNPAWLRGAPAEPAHSAAVRALLRAGADVTGIAHTDELAYGLSGSNTHYGTPPNPASPGRVPGGSSSGPASAVALGLADIGLGTDTAGSTRVPASYCGLYGLRPTHGPVPDAGRTGLAPSFDTPSWITRTPGLLDRVTDVLLPRRPAQPIERWILATDLFALADPSLRLPLQDAARAWADRLAVPLQPREDTCAAHLEEWAEALGVVQAVEMWQVHGSWLRTHHEAVSPAVAHAVAAGENMPAEYLTWARDTLSRARIALAELLPPGTALVQPATPTAAPPPGPAGAGLALRTATVRLICAASVAGLPVLTLPGVRSPAGPVGLSLLAPAGSDHALTAAFAPHDDAPRQDSP
ncbi:MULTISPECIES: amidase family protein [unclassified Streptomyces]|uniref:amidase family protein n=1 Tax=unclassified Streptomyces TaxID=2593676 RepID=UPI00099F6A69|nr:MULTISPECIES: amidase family protein [unclassified Streptomyces]MCP3769413.1 amidase family protein [Streptomyces sp. MAR25Y5]